MTQCRSRNEQGAVALLVAALALALLGLAALSVDISSQVMERQRLRNTVDAAAHAAAGALPVGENGRTAEQVARAYAADNDARVTLSAGETGVRFWCLVGAEAGQPDGDQIPSTCDPGSGPYVAKPAAGYTSSYGGKVRCDASMCKIPCKPAEGDLCNTAEVMHESEVDFAFGGAIGTPTGSTGTISGAACKGPCGAIVPNPIDFAVIGDRTSSMSSAAFNSMRNAIASMLEYLTPGQHQVALGMNSRSRGTSSSTCWSAPASNNSVSGTNTWFPVPLTSDYDLTDVTPPSSPPTLNPSSVLVNSLNCMTQSSGLGTWLAAPIDAGRYLLTTQDPNRRATAKKALFYLTDGEPNESSSGRTTNSLTSLGWGSSNASTACSNARTAATDAKSANILVVTIAYDLSTASCGSSSVLSVLAAMASPKPDGSPSVDDGGGQGSGCNTAAKIAGENGDGDYFFCTAAAADLEPIFRTAAGQITGATRLVRLPPD